MDWLMRQTNAGQSRSIQWTLTSSLEDLVFADNTVHPQLSEQADLNLKMGHSDMPKIRIIEDDLLTLLHTP